MAKAKKSTTTLANESGEKKVKEIEIANEPVQDEANNETEEILGGSDTEYTQTRSIKKMNENSPETSKQILKQEKVTITEEESPESSKKERHNFNKEVTKIFRVWLYKNRYNPYPSEAEKQQFSRKTGYTLLQINNWFINARRRLLPEYLKREGVSMADESKVHKIMRKETLKSMKAQDSSVQTYSTDKNHQQKWMRTIEADIKQASKTNNLIKINVGQIKNRQVGKHDVQNIVKKLKNEKPNNKESDVTQSKRELSSDSVKNTKKFTKEEIMQKMRQIKEKQKEDVTRESLSSKIQRMEQELKERIRRKKLEYENIKKEMSKQSFSKTYQPLKASSSTENLRRQNSMTPSEEIKRKKMIESMKLSKSMENLQKKPGLEKAQSNEKGKEIILSRSPAGEDTKTKKDFIYSSKEDGSRRIIGHKIISLMTGKVVKLEIYNKRQALEAQALLNKKLETEKIKTSDKEKPLIPIKTGNTSKERDPLSFDAEEDKSAKTSFKSYERSRAPSSVNKDGQRIINFEQTQRKSSNLNPVLQKSTSLQNKLIELKKNKMLELKKLELKRKEDLYKKFLPKPKQTTTVQTNTIKNYLATKQKIMEALKPEIKAKFDLRKSLTLDKPISSSLNKNLTNQKIQRKSDPQTHTLSSKSPISLETNRSSSLMNIKDSSSNLKLRSLQSTLQKKPSLQSPLASKSSLISPPAIRSSLRSLKSDISLSGLSEDLSPESKRIKKERVMVKDILKHKEAIKKENIPQTQKTIDLRKKIKTEGKFKIKRCAVRLPKQDLLKMKNIKIALLQKRALLQKNKQIKTPIHGIKKIQPTSTSSSIKRFSQNISNYKETLTNFGNKNLKKIVIKQKPAKSSTTKTSFTKKNSFENNPYENDEEDAEISNSENEDSKEPKLPPVDYPPYVKKEIIKGINKTEKRRACLFMLVDNEENEVTCNDGNTKEDKVLLNQLSQPSEVNQPLEENQPSEEPVVMDDIIEEFDPNSTQAVVEEWIDDRGETYEEYQLHQPDYELEQYLEM